MLVVGGCKGGEAAGQFGQGGTPWLCINAGKDEKQHAHNLMFNQSLTINTTSVLENGLKQIRVNYLYSTFN